MDNYSINITWSDEDQGYVAIIPEFKNLSAFGETYEGAILEARKVLEGYIETFKEDDIPLPEPSTLSSYSGQLRLRLSKKLHQELAIEAKKNGVSLNNYMTTLLSHNLAVDKCKNFQEKHVFVTVLTPSDRSDTKTMVYPRINRETRSKDTWIEGVKND